MAKKVDDLFLKVNGVINSVADETGLGKLDLVSRNVLIHICAVSADGSNPRVTEVMDARQLGSRQTIHGRIHELMQHGWVSAVTDNDDGRAKLLQPTPLALKAVNRLSNSLRTVFPR